MGMMNVFLWIVFGVATGLVIYALDYHAKRRKLLEVLLLGVNGAIVGGLVSNIVFGEGISGIHLASLMVASAGALIVWYAGRAMKKL